MIIRRVMGVGEIVKGEWAESIEFKLESLFHCGRHHHHVCSRVKWSLESFSSQLNTNRLKCWLITTPLTFVWIQS